MKLLFLSACLVAVTAASAAGLKAPSEVAREWGKTIEDARETVKSADNLIAHSAAAVSKPLSAPWPVLTAPDAPKRMPPGPLYDAPSHHRFRKLPHDRPPATMPWEYNGRTR